MSSPTHLLLQENLERVRRGEIDRFCPHREQDHAHARRNASATQPAKFLAFFVKGKGAPIVLPVQ